MRKPATLSRDSDLTGYWSGEYWYDQPVGPRTPFSAHIEDSAGRLVGTTLEPNTHLGAGAAERSADITGAREGATVLFTKVYHMIGGRPLAPIRYSGSCDDKFTRIEGDWRIGDGTTGGFLMTRASFGAKAEIRREAVVLQFKR